MRPKSLEVSGYTCFKERQEPIDFASLALFAISGPTGAGKSSLLDAMVFALFGEVPRMGSKGLNELISHGLDQMSVVFDFEVGGAVYRVARKVYRTKTATKAQLEELRGDKTVPLAEKVKDVDSEVKRILGGIDYDAFVQSVLLPQGQFARFLQSQPGEQRKILRELLRLQIYEEMRARAAEQAKALKAQVASREGFLAKDYADATPERKEALSRELAAVAKELTELRERAAAERKQADALEARYQLGQELDRKRQALKVHEARDIEADKARLSADERAGQVLPHIEALDRTALKDAGIDVERVTGEALARQAEALDYSAEIHAALRAAKADAEALGQVRKECTRVIAEGAQAESAHTRAKGDYERAKARGEQAEADRADMEKALAKAQGELERAERDDLAGRLRAHLHPGEACPVCTQTVTEVPESAPAPKLDRLRKRMAQAQKAFDKAAVDEKAAHTGLAVATSELERTTAAAKAAKEAETAAAKALDERLRALAAHAGPWPKTWPTGWLDDSEKLPELRVVATLAQADKDERIDGTLRQLGRALSAAKEQGFATLGDARRARLGGQERERLRSGIESWASEREVLRARIRELEAQLAGSVVSAEEVQAAKKGADEAEAKKDALVRREGELSSQLRQIDERIRQAALHRTEVESARARQGLYDTLATELSSAHFQDYILERTFRDLARGASNRLYELSGRYTLEYRELGKSKRFFVIDHDNAREQRSADTLSGGETFLTSLALALELSEQIQRSVGAVKLDSIFIDEGFGTLDAETLDTVAQVIESLTGADRMVGIITHLQSLTERMPARIEVEKRPQGSRLAIVRS